MPEDDRTDAGYRPQHLAGGVESIDEPNPVSGDTLGAMLRRQYELQVDIFKCLPVVDADDRAYYLSWNHTALIKELGEALDEVSWKPWATDEFFNRDAYLKELVDAWHFLMNAILVAKLERQTIPDLSYEFYNRYMQKAKINQERQETPGGYQVIGTKCPDCGRAIEDGIPAEIPERYRREEDRLAVPFKCYCGRINYLVTAGHDPAPS